MQIRKGDLLIFVVLVVIGISALVLQMRYLPRQEFGNEVSVEIDGTVVKRYDLGLPQENVEIETGRGVNVLAFDRGKVRVIEANCPDQICVNFGWVQRSGQTIVCLPHRLIVRVIDQGPEQELDGFTF